MRRLTDAPIRCSSCGGRPAVITWTVHVDELELTLPLCSQCGDAIEAGITEGRVSGVIDIPASADKPARYYLAPRWAGGQSVFHVELHP